MLDIHPLFVVRVNTSEELELLEWHQATAVANVLSAIDDVPSFVAVCGCASE